MKNKILIGIFFCNLNLIFSQHCVLQDSSFNLSQVIVRTQHCDTLTIIKYCINFQNSKKLNWSLYLYLKGDNKSAKIEESRNFARLERFTSIFYIHNNLINKDTSRKDVAALVIKGKFIYDNYMNNEYVFGEKERKKLIKHNLQLSEKYDKEIDLYYKIIRDYLNDFENKGEIIAKQNYLSKLNENKIKWIFNWQKDG